MNRNSIVPDIIKVAAVVTAMPRWVLALLAADGFTVPVSWAWVHGVSAVFGAMMTVLEGFAIAYVLGAMVMARGPQLRWLAGLVGLTCVSFIGVLAPSIYSRVTGAAVGAVLPAWGIWSWSACVAASTILTVAAVGYAQAVVTSANDWRKIAAQWQGEAEKLRAELDEQDKQMRTLAEQAARAAQPIVQGAYTCAQCGASFEKQQGLAAHMRHIHRDGHGTAVTAAHPAAPEADAERA